MQSKLSSKSQPFVIAEKRSRKKRSRNRRRNGQRQAVSSGAIAKPFPAKFRVLQTYNSVETLSAAAVTRIVRGISEFLAKPPMYYNYMYGIYKYARVLAVEIESTVVATGTDPLRLALGRVPYSDTSGITYQQFAEMPETKSLVLSAKGGVDRITLQSTFVAKNAVGENLTDHSYWIDSAQAISATPLHTTDYVALLLSDPLGAASGAYVNHTVRYHIEWFDLQYAV